jgi:hypothetical protein
MTDIRFSQRVNHITCSELSEIDPEHPCIVAIEGDAGKVTFTGEWGSGVVEVTTRADTLTVATLTWQEIKALEQALNLLAHVVTRTGDY